MKQYNLIGTDGTMVFDVWLNRCPSSFKYIGEEFYKVGYSGQQTEYMILDKNLVPLRGMTGTLAEVCDFKGGVAAIRMFDNDGLEWNFINKKGKLVSDDWFSSVSYVGNDIPVATYSYTEKFLVDKKKGRMSKIGRIEDDIHFGEYEVAPVWRYDDQTCNIINKDGELLFDEWFTSADYDPDCPFEDGYIAVRRASDGKWNFIDPELRYLSDEWFARAVNFYYGYAPVKRSSDGKWNFMDKNCRYICKEWYDKAYIIGGKDDYIMIVGREDGKLNCVDVNGNLLSKDLWFDELEASYGDHGGVFSIGEDEFEVDGNGNVTPR